METTRVEGARKDCPVLLFALSTCGWCRRTREFLETNGVDYEYIYVDQLKGDARKEALDALRKWTPRQAFPTVIVGEEVLVGLDEDKLREALGL